MYVCIFKYIVYFNNIINSVTLYRIYAKTIMQDVILTGTRMLPLFNYRRNHCLKIRLTYTIKAASVSRST